MGRTLELTTITKDGTEFPVELSVSAVKLKGKWNAIGIIRDISERKRAQEALQREELQYRTTIDSMGEGIHVVDRDLRLVFCNTACQKWVKDLGLEMGTVGQNIFEAFPFLPDEIRDEYRQVFDTGKTLVTEEVNEIGGKKLLTETLKIPVREEKKVVRVITVVRDIRRRKRAEKKSE